MPLNFQWYETHLKTQDESSTTVVFHPLKLKALYTPHSRRNASSVLAIICLFPQAQTYLSWHLLLSFCSPKMSESVLGIQACSCEIQGCSLLPRTSYKYCLSANSNTWVPGERGQWCFDGGGGGGGGKGGKEKRREGVCFCVCIHVKAS